jgi:UDP-N-acetylmuramate--L-alanine ligase
MSDLNLDEVHKIYFIGIGGIAMSATAGFAKASDFEVSGSDSKEVYDPAKSVLEKYQIPYHVGYEVSQVAESGADLYVASAGEDLRNPEMAYLKEHDIQPVSLSELLYALTKDKLRVVVAGTHGKSTTAGLLGRTLQEIDNSSFLTGAVLQGDEQTNFHNGDGHYFVVEGDEYKALYDDPTPKFQQYHPDILVLNNLEFDHPDVFSNLEELKDEFRQLIDSMPSDALIVHNADSAELASLMHEHNIGNVSFGIHNPADFMAEEISYNSSGTDFSVKWTKQGKEPVVEKYKIILPGEMNIYNALAVIATLRTLGFPVEQVQEGLVDYRGVKRRFELIGEKNGITIYDDYAHHPTAVRETLLAARTRFPNQRIWAIFEPHTFTRTEATLADLAKSFIAANKVLISEIYPAREQKTANSITGEQVIKEVSKHHPDVRLVADKDQALFILENEVESGEVIIIMAVGSFNTLAGDIINRL